jgi:hypothetical protein
VNPAACWRVPTTAGPARTGPLRAGPRSSPRKWSRRHAIYRPHRLRWAALGHRTDQPGVRGVPDRSPQPCSCRSEYQADWQPGIWQCTTRCPGPFSRSACVGGYSVRAYLSELPNRPLVSIKAARCARRGPALAPGLRPWGAQAGARRPPRPQPLLINVAHPIPQTGAGMASSSPLHCPARGHRV